MKSLCVVFTVVLLSIVSYGRSPMKPPKPLPVVAEEWGGKGISLIVTDQNSAQFGFDCARGDVAAGKWPKNQSRVEAAGTYTKRTGIRPPPGYKPLTEKATYSANIDYAKKTMTVTIKIGKEQAIVYRLVKDKQGDLKRCM